MSIKNLQFSGNVYEEKNRMPIKNLKKLPSMNDSTMNVRNGGSMIYEVGGNILILWRTQNQ